ncbi:MAG TPA: phosphate ABC transporter substrate-binding protein PstS [Candidatus Sulfotelmatobacter sp.]|nr:phosphate ABC transporter substrate-binding protein PstS [Candidatus Sulfotelmatobacter sp.]
MPNLRHAIGIVALIAFFTACNSSGTPPANDKSLIGAGSTFINPAMSHWISSYQSGHPGVQINYQSIGSGGGIQQLKKGLVDFGASDAALDDQQMQEMPPLVQIPESAGPVCITYNLPDLKTPLKLSPETLAGIFLGEIKTWQDPALKKDNPGVALPNSPIVVAHRSDGSGTTNIFTMYLAKVSPAWEKKVGKGISVSWPVGVGGKGSEGVTGTVRQTPGAIGYVELSYAAENKLPVALIRNQAGNWIEPTAAAATAAIEAFHDELAKDVRTPVVNPPASAKDAYPISGLTYLLVPKQGKSQAKQQTLKDFVQYIISDGQSAAENLQYSKLPPSLAGQDQQLLGQLQSTM